MKKIYLSELVIGIKEELEHKDVTKGNLLTTAKIAIVHLKEDEHYYTKLKKAGLIQNPIKKRLPGSIASIKPEVTAIPKAVIPVTLEQSAGTHWMKQVSGLDRRGASDSKYRSILSTAGKALSESEKRVSAGKTTWRSEVIRLAERDLERHPIIEVKIPKAPVTPRVTIPKTLKEITRRIKTPRGITTIEPKMVMTDLVNGKPAVIYVAGDEQFGTKYFNTIKEANQYSQKVADKFNLKISLLEDEVAIPKVTPSRHLKVNPRHVLTKEESKRGFRAAVESVQMKYGLDFNEAVQWILRKSARKAGYAGSWVAMREAGYKRANPTESYVTKANVIVPGKPQYRGYFIVATGFMIPQCKRILKKKAIRIYSLSSPEYVRKLDKAAFAFESAKLRDEALKKILTKMKNKYIIRYTKGYWYFTKKED